MAYATPWIVEFSGGKDSTTFLQVEKDKSGLMRRKNLFKDFDMTSKNYLKRQSESFQVS